MKRPVQREHDGVTIQFFSYADKAEKVESLLPWGVLDKKHTKKRKEKRLCPQDKEVVARFFTLEEACSWIDKNM